MSVSVRAVLPPLSLRATLLALSLGGCHVAETGADGGAKTDANLPADAAPDGPLVRILAPTAATDPTTEAVVVGSDVAVQCEVKARSEQQRVNPTTVMIQVFSGDGETASAMAQAHAIDGDTYGGTISVKDIPAGSLRFVCSARDTRIPAGLGRDELSTFLDHGPLVRFEVPDDGAAVARKDTVLIRFQVSPEPLLAGDTGAAVADVKLLLNGKDREPAQEAHGFYSLSVALDDESVFPRTEKSLAITVTAQNSRSPESATRSVSRSVAIDGEGPTITVVSPTEASFVGQKADLNVKIVDDASGVRAGSARVTITVDDVSEQIALTPSTAVTEKDVFRATINPGKYLERAQLTLNVIAEDNAGNETRVSRLVFVDSVPPWVSLDPPVVRAFTRNAQTASYECSAPFDPVGDNAVDDLARLSTEFATYRALVYERGISLDGQNVVNVSKVKDGSVALFVQGRRDVPLLVDSDGDHLCDAVAVNPDPARPELAPVKVTLAGIRTQGYTQPGALASVDAAPALGTFCTPSPSRAPVATACSDSPMTYVPRHSARDVGSIVYGLAPSALYAVGCTGREWQASLGAGWACVVGTATDEMGNVGFSAPLRACYDLAGQSADCAQAAPSCTDGCVLPEFVSARGMPLFLDATP